MTRLSRLVLGAGIVTTAACAGTPTDPQPAPNTMSPEVGALLDETPPDDCRGGYSVTNGKAC